MADSKKYDGSQWEHSLRKLTTATEAVENPLYSDGTAITAYTLKGNEEHTGTPTPSNPVDVQGVGIKTANLINLGSWSNQYSTDTRTFFSARFRVSGGTYKQIDVKSTGTYKLTLDNLTNETVEFLHNGSARNILIFSYTANFAEPTNLTVSFTVSGYDPTTINGINLSGIMLNTGSTPLPYEPYGYKIPILTAQGSAVNYLGSVQSTRQIGKIVFDGTESFSKDSDSGNSARYYIDVAGMKSYTADLLSTHYTQSNTYDVNTIRTYQTQLYFSVDKTIYATTTDFQTYLQQQYAAGTPVTVWYALQTATTGIVNEPLMKIGDYSDSISNAATIPTTEGANSITVDTTVQPSEFTATWTGWHDSSVKEYDGTNWQ